MKEEIVSLLEDYTLQKISKEEFVSAFPSDRSQRASVKEEIFYSIISRKDSQALEHAFFLVWIFDNDDVFISIMHQLILAPWHTRYEEIAHYLQKTRSVKSVPYLRKAMQAKYDYLESYDTGTWQFINQCGHALWSIGTSEAISVIKELSLSPDPILKDEMLYRLSRIEGRNDYQRKDDL